MKRPHRRRILGQVVGPVVVLLVVAPACIVTDDDDDSGLVEMTAEVEAFDNYFKSTTVILEPDTEATVTFINNGTTLHSFTVPDLDIETEAESAETSTVTFATTGLAGAYEFLCKYHPDEMNGTLTVEADTDVDVDEDEKIEVDVEESEYDL